MARSKPHRISYADKVKMNQLLTEHLHKQDDYWHYDKGWSDDSVAASVGAKYAHVVRFRNELGMFPLKRIVTPQKPKRKANKGSGNAKLRGAGFYTRLRPFEIHMNKMVVVLNRCLIEIKNLGSCKDVELLGLIDPMGPRAKDDTAE